MPTKKQLHFVLESELEFGMRGEINGGNQRHAWQARPEAAV